MSLKDKAFTAYADLGIGKGGCPQSFEVVRLSDAEEAVEEAEQLGILRLRLVKAENDSLAAALSNPTESAELIAEAREPHYHDPKDTYYCTEGCLVQRLANSLEQSEREVARLRKEQQ